MKCMKLRYFVSLILCFVTNGPVVSTEGTPDNVVTFRKADATLEFAAFNGDKIVVIKFKFKTTASDGVMIHGTGDAEDDFIQIGLKQRDPLQLSYNFGNGIKVLEYRHNGTLNNDLWHTLYVEVNPNQILLRVDNLTSVVRNETNIDVIRLRNLTVGAAEDYSSGFVGCMGDMKVNDILVDLQGSVRDGRLIYGVHEGCVKTNKCASNPCFNRGQCLEGYSQYTCDCSATPFGGSVCSKEVGVGLQYGTYIRFDDAQSLLESGFNNITFGFMASIKQGILLQLRNKRNTESLSIEMNNNGGIKYVIQMEFERYELNTHWNSVDLTDGEGHEVVIWRENNGRSIHIQVDNLDPTIGMVYETMAKVIPENPEYMFIGNNETGRSFMSFKGCIYRMQIGYFYPLKTAFQDPRPSGVTLVQQDKIREDTCGIEEIIHEPEQMELRPYKPTCENLTLTDLGLEPEVDASNESKLLFTISKSNNTFDSYLPRTLSITCSFNVTYAKLLYYIVIRRETSPGSGIFECIAKLEADSTKTSKLYDQITSDKDFIATGTLDTSSTSHPFLKLEMEREKLTSSDVRSYTCEAAYKYSTKDTLSTSRTLGAIREDMIEDLVTFEKADATLEFASIKGDQINEIWHGFKTTASDGVMVHSTGAMKDDFIQIRLTDGNTVEFVCSLGNNILRLKYRDSYILNDDEWHVVHVKLNQTIARLLVDNSEAVNATNIGLTGKMKVMVGAAADHSNGFIGCMRDLKINGVLIDMRRSVRNDQYIYGVHEGCSGKCASNPCFNDGQCKERYSHFTCDCSETPCEGSVCSKEVGVSMRPNFMIRIDDIQSLVRELVFQNITLGFITKKKQGILLQARDENNREYTSLQMNNNGGIKFVLDVRAGQWQLNTDLNFLDLSDGQAHVVHFWREWFGRKVYLQVDSYEPTSGELWEFESPSDVNLVNPKYLFIGNNDTENFANGFEGCIYHLKFDGIFYPLKTAFRNPRPSYVNFVPTKDIMHKDACGFEEIKHEPERPELRPYQPTCGNMTISDLGMEHQEGEQPSSLLTFSRNDITLDSDARGTLTMTCRVNTTNAKLVYYIVFRRETAPGSDVFECLARIEAGSSKTAVLYDHLTNDRDFDVSGSTDTLNSSVPYLTLQMDVQKLTCSDAKDYICEVAYKNSTISALKTSRTTDKLSLSLENGVQCTDQSVPEEKVEGRETDNKAKTGLIVGVTLGVVAVIVIVVVTACYCVARRRKMDEHRVLYNPTR